MPATPHAGAGEVSDKAETRRPRSSRSSTAHRNHSATACPIPIVYDGSAQAVRQRTVNFAAKRFADMLYVSGLDRETAARHFRWRAVALPGGLNRRPAAGDQAVLDAAYRAGHIRLEADNADQRVTVTWNGPDFQRRVIGSAIARPNYGGILLGPHAVPAFNPKPIERHLPAAGHAWPLGEAVEPPPPPPVKLVAALRTFFANSVGAYGILIASPEQILVERYSAFGAPDRATPSWSMTKAFTCTLIGRLIHEGWLASVYDPAPAPLWRDPRGDPPSDHARSSAAHAVRAGVSGDRRGRRHFVGI